MNLFKNRTAIGILCILLSLLVCFGLMPLFNKSISQKTEIVRVVKEIKAGDEITKDMVQLTEVGAYGLPESIIKQTDTVIGKFATADLLVGDFILNTKLSDTPGAENAYLYRLDGRKQAMSVTIKNFANGLSGKLISGDIVSVIAADYKKQGITVIPPELKYVEIISVTASSGYDANTGETQKEEEDRELPSTVTLFVSPEQSRVLAELEADGKLHLSLVYRGTPENRKEFTDMQEAVNAKLYPVEENPEEATEETEEIAEEKKVNQEDATVEELEQQAIASTTEGEETSEVETPNATTTVTAPFGESEERSK